MFAKKRNTSPEKSQQHIVLYDDQCPLCVFQKRALGWLDWMNSLSFVAISEAKKKGLASISREELLEAIHCLAADGRLYRGARCIRFVGMRMPLLFPAALILWLPGVISIAEIIYQFVSRNRHLFSRWFGCKGACQILPDRQSKKADNASSQDKKHF